MNYLDYAYELNKLDEKFESDRDFLLLVKELRSVLINKESDKLLDITFKVFDMVNIEESFIDGEELEDEYDKGYQKGYSDAIKEAVSSIEDLSPY